MQRNHLDLIELAAIAEFLCLPSKEKEKAKSIKALLKHIEECANCRNEVIELHDLLQLRNDRLNSYVESLL